MVLKADKEFATNRKQKGSVREETSGVSRHDGDERAKPNPRTAPPSEPPTQRGRSASRKKNLRGRSPSGKFDRQPCKDYLKKVSALNHLVTVGILPNVNSISLNRIVNSAISGHLHTGRLRDNPAKSRRRMVTKVQ